MKNSRLEQLREFHKDQPEDPFIKYALATEYLKLGHTTAALEWFERLIKEHSEYLGTYYHLGKLYEQLGRIQEAETIYTKGADLARRQGNQQTLAELRSALAGISGSDEEDE